MALYGIQNLTNNEKALLDRFNNINYSTLPKSVKDILDQYKDDLFFKDVFIIIVQDVFNVLSIEEWNDSAHEKIIAHSKYICEKTGLFFPAGRHILFALPIIWIAHFCKYKQYGTVYTLSSKIRGIVNNSKYLEQSISANFFNFFAGPMLGKAKLCELYMFKTHGYNHRDLRKNENHTLNFNTLIHFLSLTGFSYQINPVDISQT